MSKLDLTYRQIGLIHSPHKQAKGAPIQPCGARGVTGTVEVFDEYQEGLKDLDGFSHIILLYHCHLAKPYTLLAKPFMSSQEMGIFATRAPARPNPIGISVVRLESVKGNLLKIGDVDILDRTPLLDIKPLVPEFDQPSGEVRIGWLQKTADKASHTRSDARFS